VIFYRRTKNYKLSAPFKHEFGPKTALDHHHPECFQNLAQKIAGSLSGLRRRILHPNITSRNGRTPSTLINNSCIKVSSCLLFKVFVCNLDSLRSNFKPRPQVLPHTKIKKSFLKTYFMRPCMYISIDPIFHIPQSS
jgi:hypothetical protein